MSDPESWSWGLGPSAEAGVGFDCLECRFQTADERKADVHNALTGHSIGIDYINRESRMADIMKCERCQWEFGHHPSCGNAPLSGDAVRAVMDAQAAIHDGVEAVWRGEMARLESERDRLREFVVDLAEGWVGDVQSRAQRELRRARRSFPTS